MKTPANLSQQDIREALQTTLMLGKILLQAEIDSLDKVKRELSGVREQTTISPPLYVRVRRAKI